MEQLRKIFKRLAKAPEKIVFAIMVMVLIWRVVQIVMPGTDQDGPQNPPTPIPTADPEPANQPADELPSRYADISLGKWDLLGGDIVTTDDGETEDANLPDIRLDRIEEVRGTLYAWISVDDGRAQAKRKGQDFADRQAVLDEVDAGAGKIEFTWRPTNRKYERTTAG